MKISIIVPVYNVEKYVGECLSSVAAQDYDGEIECIIIDDCGTDSSMEVVGQFVNSYKGRIEFKVLHHTHNRGLSAARNTGMAAATGEYIFFLDSDDEISADCLRRLSEPLMEQAYDVVIGNYRKMQDGQFQEDVHPNHLDSGGIIKAFALRWIDPMAWNKLYRKSFLISNGISFFEGIIHEDELWSMELMCISPSVSLILEITYNYRIRSDSIMDMAANKCGKWQQKSYIAIISEIVRFAGKTDMLGNYWMNYYIQFLLSQWSFRVYTKSNGFSAFYRAIRDVPISKYKMTCANGMKVKSIIRDLHWYFPLRFGEAAYKNFNIRYYLFQANRRVQRYKDYEAYNFGHSSRI